MADHILNFINDYVLPAVVMTGGTVIFSLAVIKAWEMLLVDAPLVCL
jgi:hypothetical protein